MSDTPTLLFLHGVGSGDPGDRWKSALSSALLRLGYPALDGVTAIAPKFAHALKGADDSVPVPPISVPTPTRDAARNHRRNFEHRSAAIELRLGNHELGDALPAAGALVDGALMLPKVFAQARNYVGSQQIRAQVLTKILNALPSSGKLVIVAHSLGSVIASDLLRRLPHDLEVAGLITVGSPLGNVSFNVDDLRRNLKDPPANLAWWVNFWNPFDPVTAGRGLSSTFHWLVDLRVSTRLDAHTHDAVTYLSDETVATAIGFALFGSKSREIEPISTSVDMQLDAVEEVTLLALRYATLIKLQLDGEQRARYEGALRQVQGTEIAAIIRRNASHGRTTPAAVARLHLDLSDPDAPAPEPLPVAHTTRTAAVVPLTLLAAINTIRPFEIDLPLAKREQAMRDLSAELGLGTQFGADVFRAAKTAHEVLTAKSNISWLKWGVMGLGAAALVAATGGLALAAAPAAAGAAAITSALAAFGPGGMIGGLLTAGALATAGGGGIAFGLANSGASAEALEAVLQQQLATAILRQFQHIDPDPSIWFMLADTETELRRQYERMDEFSDPASTALAELRKKLSAMERALDYLREQKLDPISAAETVRSH